MSELRDQQMAFAAHIRDPRHHAAPEGIEDRRLAIYRELFFNGLEALLSGNFPVIRATLGEDPWRALVRKFYAEHRCTTPLFTGIAKEFADWLAAGEHGPAWLPELAQYEWVELALAISDAPLPPHDPNGDVLDGVPVASPHAWPLAYHWPVHRIGPGHVPGAPPERPTLLLVRRDSDGNVRFSELSPLAFRLLVAIDANDAGRTGAELVQALGGVAAEGIALLRRLHTDGILLGTP